MELQQIIDAAPIPDSPLHLLVPGSTRHTTERPEKKRKLTECTSLGTYQPEELPPLQTAWTTDTQNLEEAYAIIKTESSAMVHLTDRAIAWFLLSHCDGKDRYSKTSETGHDPLVIREELLSELYRAQEAGINMHASITKSHLSRADLRSKIAEHPEIKDYMLAFQAHDEHQVLLLRQNIRDLRNVYVALYDLAKTLIA